MIFSLMKIPLNLFPYVYNQDYSSYLKSLNVKKEMEKLILNIQ